MSPKLSQSVLKASSKHSQCILNTFLMLKNTNFDLKLAYKFLQLRWNTIFELFMAKIFKSIGKIILEQFLEHFNGAHLTVVLINRCQNTIVLIDWCRKAVVLIDIVPKRSVASKSTQSKTEFTIIGILTLYLMSSFGPRFWPRRSIKTPYLPETDPLTQKSLLSTLSLVMWLKFKFRKAPFLCKYSV